MSGSLSGIGSALQGATALAQYVIGANTSSNSVTNGTGTNKSNVTTNVTGTTSTSSSGSTVTQNTTDPGIIAMLKSLATTAISNSTDPNKTSGLLSGILQQAGDAMTSIFGKQSQSGIYDSSAAASMNNDILSRATADAAAAMTSYQTGQQQLADQALNQVGNLTSGQTVNTASQSSTTDSATTNVSSDTTITNNSQVQSKSKSGMSVVCTWMMQQKLLSVRDYATVTTHFYSLPWWQQAGYLAVAGRLVEELERDRDSWVSKATLAVFGARTSYVCACIKPGGKKKTAAGWFARALVAIVCAVPSLFILVKSLANRSQVCQGR